MKMFLDKNKPLYTCDEKTCNNCDVKTLINCHFNMEQLMRFFIIAVPFYVFYYSNSGKIETICVHHFILSLHEIMQEFILRVLTCIDFRNGTELCV